MVARGEAAGRWGSVSVVDGAGGFLRCSAPAGRGGEGSGFWRWLGDGGGGPGRRRRGWKKGGCGELALWLCTFIDSRFRCLAADGSCGRLQCVVVPSSRRMVVRRLRRRLGGLGSAVDPIELLLGGLGCFVHFSGFLCNFVFLWGPVCKSAEPPNL